MNRNPNLKIVGLFGQSGAGKTTVIRNVPTPVNGYRIAPCTGIIRLLFSTNNTPQHKTYYSPMEILRYYENDLNTLKGTGLELKIDEIYEKYLKSQIQLLNDFTSEVLLLSRDKYNKPAILMTDRAPIDFYAITVGGIKTLQSRLKKQLNDQCKSLLTLNKKIAEDNTVSFYDSIIITHPWKDQSVSKLKDGIRDEYLSEYYTGDNWYGIIDTVDLGKVKKFVVGSDLIDLEVRANKIAEFLKEI